MSQSHRRWDTRLGVSEGAGGCRYVARAGSGHRDHCGNNGLLGRCDDQEERRNHSLMGEGVEHCRREEGVVDNYRGCHSHH